MKNYYSLLQDIIDNGYVADNRTGTDCLSVFGRQLRFDLNEGFPLLPGKFTPFNLVAAELLWILSGSTNNEDLRKLNGNDRATIWEEWSLPNGDLGPIYGEQWRFGFSKGSEGNVDQIQNLIDGLRERPNSRRHIVSAWNPSCLPDEWASIKDNILDDKMALAPCHYSFQMYLRNGKLSCLVNMRSVDTFLGLPFNIASYALLTHMIAHVIDVEVGELIMSLGDTHIYMNHIDQVNELLARDHSKNPLCTLVIKSIIRSIDDFTSSDFAIINYRHYPAIKAPVAI